MSGSRPRGRPKEFDRDQALAGALELFWSRGYEATGLSDLLAEMGIGRQSLYDTFGNKRALYLAVLERYGETELGRVLELLEAPGSPLGNVERVLDAWLDAATSPQCRGCLVGNGLAEFGGRDPEVAAVLRRQVERLEGAFRSALGRAREAGELPADAEPRELAWFLTAIGQATSLLGKLGLDREVIESVVKVARERLAC